MDIFCPKQNNFQDPCIKHLQYSRKALFPLISESFLKLIDFTINFFAKEVALFTFFSPELTLKIPPNPRFRFNSVAQNENAESVEIFSFLFTYKTFYQTLTKQKNNREVSYF